MNMEDIFNKTGCKTNKLSLSGRQWQKYAFFSILTFTTKIWVTHPPVLRDPPPDRMEEKEPSGGPQIPTPEIKSPTIPPPRICTRESPGLRPGDRSPPPKQRLLSPPTWICQGRGDKRSDISCVKKREKKKTGGRLNDKMLKRR